MLPQPAFADRPSVKVPRRRTSSQQERDPDSAGQHTESDPEQHGFGHPEPRSLPREPIEPVRCALDDPITLQFIEYPPALLFAKMEQTRSLVNREGKSGHFAKLGLNSHDECGLRIFAGTNPHPICGSACNVQRSRRMRVDAGGSHSLQECK